MIRNQKQLFLKCYKIGFNIKWKYFLAKVGYKMSIKDEAQAAHANLLAKTDPEALERINHFAFDEVQTM